MPAKRRASKLSKRSGEEANPCLISTRAGAGDDLGLWIGRAQGLSLIFGERFGFVLEHDAGDLVHHRRPVANAAELIAREIVDAPHQVDLRAARTDEKNKRASCAQNDRSQLCPHA